MPTARINKSNVDATAKAVRDVFLWDDKIPGFGLKVTPAGSKVYLYQYRLHGGRGAKVERYTIGKHGPLTPDQARTEANRLAMLVAQGTSPQRDKVERKRQAIDLAFPAYLDAFAKDCLAANWKGSAAEVEAMLRSHALPSLKTKALPEITRTDIAAIMRAGKV